MTEKYVKKAPKELKNVKNALLKSYGYGGNISYIID